MAEWRNEKQGENSKLPMDDRISSDKWAKNQKNNKTRLHPFYMQNLIISIFKLLFFF